MDWQIAERVQKNDQGQYRALINGEWVTAEAAQKNDAGEYRVRLRTKPADQSEKPKQSSALANIAGSLFPAIEPVAHLATSMVAKPVSEIAGLAGVGYNRLTGQTNDVEGFRQEMADRITYSPRSAAARAAVESPLNPINILGNIVTGTGNFYHRLVGGGAEDSSARGMAANATREIAQQALGFAGVKGANDIARLPAQAANAVGDLRPVAYVSGVAKNVFGPESGVAGRLMNKVAESGRPGGAAAIINELENAASRVPGERLTAGEAAVAAMNPGFSALQEIVASKNPNKYGLGGIQSTNEAARQAMLGAEAGTQYTLPLIKFLRDEVTGPKRETAMANADMANRVGPPLEARLTAQQEALVNALQDKGRFQTMAAQQEGLSSGVPINLRGGRGAQPTNEPYFNVGATGGRAPAQVVPDGSLPPNVPFRMQGTLPERRLTDNFAQSLEAQAAAKETAGIEAARRAQAGLTKYQLDSLAEHGHYPLKTDSVISVLDGQINSPVAPTVVKKTLQSIKDNILGRASQDGSVSTAALYTVRKEIGDTIKTHAKDTNNWDKRLAAGTEITVQKVIDDAIERAGGQGWRDYLKTYREMSGPIEKVTTAQALQDVLTRKPASFADAAREAGPIASENLQGVVNAIEGSLKRESTHKALAAEGRTAAGEALGVTFPKLPGPGMFSPVISTTRAALNRATGLATNNLLRYMAENMDNPAKIAQIMREATPSQRIAIESILRQQMVRGGGLIAPSSEQRNRIKELTE